MLIAAVLCLCAAVATAVTGLWALAHPRPGDPARRVLRAVAPTQLAAAPMLAAGATIALVAQPTTGLVILVLSVVGAVGTVAAGCYQAARAAARSPATPTGCAGSCQSCVLPCS
jgi:drug/metabolite transporter (DMT)-like permease